MIRRVFSLSPLALFGLGKKKPDESCSDIAFDIFEIAYRDYWRDRALRAEKKLKLREEVISQARKALGVPAFSRPE